MRTARPVALAPSCWVLALIANLGLGACRPPAAPVAVPASRPARAPEALTPLDLSREVLATLVVPSLAASSRRAAAYLQPHLAGQPPLRAAVAPAALTLRFLRIFGLASFRSLLDPNRPLALVVAYDQRAPRHGLRAWTSLALPARDPAALSSMLAARFDSHHRIGKQVWEFRRRGRGLLWVREQGEWLLLAPSRRLARAAPALLLPLLRGRSGDLRLTLQVERLSRRFPAAFARLLARRSWWPRALGLGGWTLLPSNAEAMDWLADVRRLTLRCDFEAQRLSLRGAVASRGGVLTRELAALRSGKPWGLALLPEHAPLVLSRRVHTAARRAAWEAVFAQTGGMPAVAALAKAARSLLGELGTKETLAVVTPPTGGFTLMALQQLKGDARQVARRAHAVLEALAKPVVLSRWSTAKGAPRLRVAKLRRFRRPSSAGVLELRWAKERAAEPTSLRRWRALFGPRPCVGYRLVADPGATTLALAAGGGCQEALGLRPPPTSTSGPSHRRTLGPAAQPPTSWLLWVSLAQAIAQALPVVAALRQLPPQLGAMVRQLLAPGMLRRSAPLALRADARKGELHWQVDVSAGLMALVAKGLGLLYAIGSYGGPAPSAPSAPSPLRAPQPR